jgi:hypothetical protein
MLPLLLENMPLHMNEKMMIILPILHARHITGLTTTSQTNELRLEDWLPGLHILPICGDAWRKSPCHWTSGLQQSNKSQWGGCCRHHTQTTSFHQGLNSMSLWDVSLGRGRALQTSVMYRTFNMLHIPTTQNRNILKLSLQTRKSIDMFY